ncbi:hypothetical protein [Streptomyces bluensis]|uniref:hypothetical protein n=1 Tax=Streptomyces bluensis TaxID=33897 RepID=UPI003319713E
MEEPGPDPTGAGAVLRKLVPPPALCGFLLLLALVFVASYAAGAAAGPVAPGIRGTSTGPGTTDVDDGNGDLPQHGHGDGGSGR